MTSSRRRLPGAQEVAHDGAHGRPFTDVKPPPAAPVWAAIEGLAGTTCSLAAIELGVFDAVRDAGSADAGELAERLGVSPPHLASLLDGVVALGLLDKVASGTQPTTRPGATSSATVRRAWPGSCRSRRVPQQQLDAARRHRAPRPPATPIEDDPAAFYVPLVEGTFTTMWRTASRLDRHRPLRRVPAAACSTSVPAARRGRSPSSPPAPTATPSSTTSTACSTSPAARRRSTVWPTDASSGRATTSRSTSSRAPTTSSCSATCAGPRAPSGAPHLIARAFERVATRAAG